jgi:Ca-activated chloride channel family protein
MNPVKNFITHTAPALLLGVLALFFVAAVNAQKVNDLPPAPPAPKYKPKPTPTPTPPPPDDPNDVVRVTSNLVVVPVSVVDSSGQAVHGLKVGDFHVIEAGTPQQIAEIGDPEQVPLDIALLFDISSSVSQKGFFALQQNAAATFLRQVLKPTDRAAVFTIGKEPRLVAPLATAEAAAATLQTIPAATSSVSTSFYDTVAAASKYLSTNSSGGRRRVIVVLSDGDDTSSELLRSPTTAEVRASENGETTRAADRDRQTERHHKAVLEVQRIAQQADATFYSINPGGPSVHLNQISMRAEGGMESIAAATGGTAFLPSSDQDLVRVFNEVAAELRGQYLLQYYSNSKSPGGEYRAISVTIPTHPDTHVRARQGYYPKK